ncbi:MAG: ComF family protein [Oceanicoccus sp.]|jgi:ComF family protein
MLSALKYRKQYKNGKSLCISGYSSFVSAYQGGAMPEILVPTPLHWRRQFERGFNQSELIANDFGQLLELPVIRALRRHRYTSPQQSLLAQQRHQNLSGAFTVCADIRGRRLALVDDVMTTGATAREMTKALLQAGASEVHIWVLARTPEH